MNNINELRQLFCGYIKTLTSLQPPTTQIYSAYNGNKEVANPHIKEARKIAVNYSK